MGRSYQFKTKPYPHQVRALKKLLRKNGGALAMPMRSGKTKTAIDWVGATKVLDPTINRVLVVCPKSVIGVWRAEIKKHAAVDVEWLILNPEQLYDRKKDHDNPRSWFPVDSKRILKFKPQVLIVDESHRFGDAQSLQSRKLYRYQKHLGVRYKVIMTGTMMHGKPFKVFAQWKILDDSVFGTVFGAFKRQYAVMGGFGNNMVLKYINLKQLRAKMQPKLFQMKHVPLVKPVHQVIPVALEEGARVYREMARESIVELKEGTVKADMVVTRLMRLAQIAGGHVKNEKGQIIQVGQEKRRAYQSWLEDRQEEGLDKLVVFCRFVPEIRDIAEVSKACGYKVQFIHGKVPQMKRERNIEHFQTYSEPQVMVCQISAGSVGIDLSAASTCLFYSLSESLIDYDQAMARIRKFKDKRTLAYYYLLAEGTVDNAIYLSLQKKLNLVKMIMEHPELIHYSTEG